MLYIDLLKYKINAPGYNKVYNKGIRMCFKV